MCAATHLTERRGGRTRQSTQYRKMKCNHMPVLIGTTTHAHTPIVVIFCVRMMAKKPPRQHQHQVNTRETRARTRALGIRATIHGWPGAPAPLTICPNKRPDNSFRMARARPTKPTRPRRSRQGLVYSTRIMHVCVSARPARMHIECMCVRLSKCVTSVRATRMAL